MVAVELDEVEVEDDGVLDELGDEVVKIDVEDQSVLEEEVIVRMVEEELEEVEEEEISETKVTILVSEDS